MEEPSQFSMGQTAQSLTCPIMEKQHTGLDDCLRMLLACSRKRMSVRRRLILAIKLDCVGEKEGWPRGRTAPDSQSIYFIATEGCYVTNAARERPSNVFN